MRIFSAGHGARSLDDLIATLRAGGVTQVADVRAFPGSRRHPHFAREALERSLPAAGIAYTWLPELGGRRKLASKNHPAWRVEAFAAYADHTDSDEFARGLAKLLA